MTSTCCASPNGIPSIISSKWASDSTHRSNLLGYTDLHLSQIQILAGQTAKQINTLSGQLGDVSYEKELITAILAGSAIALSTGILVSKRLENLCALKDFVLNSLGIKASLKCHL